MATENQLQRHCVCQKYESQYHNIQFHGNVGAMSFQSMHSMNVCKQQFLLVARKFGTINIYRYNKQGSRIQYVGVLKVYV